MLKTLTVLLLYQLAGETTALLLHLPVPGPLIGMLMLLATLVVRGHTPAYLREGANHLLTHLSLLFVPAGVGIMVHFGRLRDEALPIVVSLVLSTALTIAVTALILARRKPAKEGAAPAEAAP